MQWLTLWNLSRRLRNVYSRETADTLAEIGSVQAARILAESLKHKDASHRHIINVLDHINPDWKNTRYGRRACSSIVATLRHRKWRFRKSAAEVLGMLQHTRAVQPLTRVLKKDKDRLVRSRAAEALARIGHITATETLIEALRTDKESIVRCSAAEALGMIGDARAVEPLITMLTRDRAYERKSAARALGMIGDARAVDPLIARLRGEKDGFTLDATAEALGYIGDTRAVEPLITILNRQPGGGEGHGRKNAVLALGRIGGERAFEAISTMLTKGNLPQTAAQALGNLADPRGARLLVSCARERPGTAKTAINSLQKILESRAESVESGDLYEVAKLKDVTYIHKDVNTGHQEIYYSERPLNCSSVKQLAHQELTRRGLKV